MKIWTYQSKYTMDKIVKEGIYKPSFKDGSSFAKETAKSYNILKCDYEEKNNLRCEGLVFGLSRYDYKVIETFEDYKQTLKNSGVCGCSTVNPDYYLLELDVPIYIETLNCQFYNFSDLISFLDREELINRKDLISTLDNLYIDEACIDLVQSHVHYIDKSMIKGIYNVCGFDLDRDTNKVIFKEVKPANIDYYRKRIMGGCGCEEVEDMG